MAGVGIGTGADSGGTGSVGWSESECPWQYSRGLSQRGQCVRSGMDGVRECALLQDAAGSSCRTSSIPWLGAPDAKLEPSSSPTTAVAGTEISYGCVG
jgi:hypothetical protein